MKALNSGNRIYNQSLERALQILCAFSPEKRELNLVELSKGLNLPKSTVYRLCHTLVKFNFLTYNESSNRYSLGLKLFDLGNTVSSAFSIREAASIHLTGLGIKTRESVFLGILQDNQLMYLDKREAPESPILFKSELGARRPPYFGMLGQTLLAYLPEPEVDTILKKNPLKPVARRSLRTKSELRKRLAVIREQGFVIEKGEVIDGVAGIAAPIRNYTGHVIAA
ncbi:MAG: IclR family transcriptional regulator, partial [Pseudomonadota bacterium]